MQVIFYSIYGDGN